MRIWDTWEKYVYKILLYEEARNKAHGVDRFTKKIVNQLGGLVNDSFNSTFINQNQSFIECSDNTALNSPVHAEEKILNNLQKEKK